MAYVLNLNRSSIIIMSYKIQTTSFRDMQLQDLVDNLEGYFLTKIVTRFLSIQIKLIFGSFWPKKGVIIAKIVQKHFPSLYIGLE